MRRARNFCLLAFLIGFLLPNVAQGQQPPILWPDSDHPALRFTFSKFKDMGGSMSISGAFCFVFRRLPDRFLAGPS